MAETVRVGNQNREVGTRPQEEARLNREMALSWAQKISAKMQKTYKEMRDRQRGERV